MSGLPYSATTPVSVSKVGLRARDADAVARYYREVVGLAEISRSTSTIRLGAGDRVLLEIEQVAGLRPDDPRGAGLFHTAFLLPGRADLGRWTRNAIDRQLRVDGASDHLVSEAIYLTDPEGNGIEIYADRPKEAWPVKAGQIEMATNPLDIPDLVASAGGTAWTGAPEGSIVGHVHLRVGDAAAAETWWNGEMAFDTMARYGEAAVFLASGGYHHHVGANMWQSRGAGKRDDDRSGLAYVEFAAQGAAGESERLDPWGTAIRVVTKA
jgi:catechol 2,3-dioxygenase